MLELFLLALLQLFSISALLYLIRSRKKIPKVKRISSFGGKLYVLQSGRWVLFTDRVKEPNTSYVRM